MKKFFLYCFLSIPMAAFPAWPLTRGFYSLDTVGGGALIHAQYQTALKELSSQKPVIDSAFWNFKKGLAAFFLKDYESALTSLRKCASGPFCLAPVAYEYIGDAESARMRPRDALEAYLSAIKDTIRLGERARIRKKMSTVIAGSPKLTDTIPFLAQWLLDTAKTAAPQGAGNEKFPEIDSLVQCMSARCVDSATRGLFDSMSVSRRTALLSRLEALKLPDSLMTTLLLFKMSQFALESKAFALAKSWLARAQARPDFIKAVLPKTALLHQAFMAYYGGRFDTAAVLLCRYHGDYGPLPEVVLAIARSYRNLNQDALSMQWYAKFLRLFPHDPSAYTVTWFMAWDNEEKGKYSKAVELYRKVGAMRKNGRYADDWEYRIGLCSYKQEQYKRAYSLFSRYASQHPDSPQFLGALYWKAKSLSAGVDSAGSRALFLDVIRASPTDYYAYRARETLSLSGDTALIPAFDTVGDWVGARTWLDSVAAPVKDALSQADSVAFERGVRLVFSGLGPLAREYFASLESEYAANLKFQFDLAVLYDIMDDPTASFRIGRRLMWRIPQAHRVKTPFPVLSLGYPLAFMGAVNRAAQTDSIDPFLILAVMRQESVFNPAIVSRAGATGLMQLMPTTAKSVATELSETFSADSLTRFSTNIRYGSHYLKKLLDQFGGNMVLTIAAYNGGPPIVLQWLEKNKTKTFDLFIEDIGYEETRGYVKKVLANFWTYKKFSRITRFKG